MTPVFDLCISSSPFRMPGTETLPVLTEEIMLAVPSDHRLANRESIRLSELSDDSFISLKPGKQLHDGFPLSCSRIYALNHL